MYKICIHIFYCFALVNTYNNVNNFIIFFFLQMLKKITYIFILLWIVFFCYLLLQSKKDNILFPYPEWDITFAGELIPTKDDYLTLQRFDKEFTITWNNLYQFYLYVKRYPLYIPYIEQELEKNNIPDDFKYLPIAESALRDDVVSTAWAGWIWQFMPDTARQYGLRVDEYIDERYNFEKSTQAAIDYIVFLHSQFDDWSLVAASYNRWENAIKEALKRQNVDSYYDLYLNEETSRYVFRIVAIKYLIQWYFENKKIIDKLIGGVYTMPDVRYEEIGSIENLLEWSIQHWYNYRDIKNLNPWILWNTLPEWQWKIKVLNY